MSNNIRAESNLANMEEMEQGAHTQHYSGMSEQKPIPLEKGYSYQGRNNYAIQPYSLDRCINTAYEKTMKNMNISGMDLDEMQNPPLNIQD